MSDYLPKDATIEQACKWLEARTGETWILARLLEYHLRPHFWLDYTPGHPDIFGDRIEGYQTEMLFQGDMTRLESDGADALVNWFVNHDGRATSATPAMRISLSDLRFKRDCIEEVAEISTNVDKQANTEPALVVQSSTIEPPPLTTGDVAFCFAGLYWDTEVEWKDALGKQRKWLENCVVVHAQGRGQGMAPKLWNPVLIGAVLARYKHVKVNSVRAKFQTKDLLRPWLDAWKTYEADNFDTL